MNGLLRVGFAFLGALWLLAGVSSCAPEGEKQAAKPVVQPPTTPGPARHVFVVVWDTLRADHLGVLGYSRETAPFVSQLASEGILFSRAISTSSYTPESITSLFTALYPTSSPWGAGWCASPAPDTSTLAEHYQAAGYATAFFSDTPMLNSPRFTQGFDHVLTEAAYGLSGQGPRLTKLALDFVEANRDRPTFVYLHLLDPHAPYAPPTAFREKINVPRVEKPLDILEEVRPQLAALRAEGFGPGEARFEDIVASYDAEILFQDDTLRLMFDRLGQMGLRDETLLVLTSDHGEEFLDHGFVEHAWQLYLESIHVPLLFWSGARLVPGRIDTWVSLTDVMPSLLTLSGLTHDASGWDGVSFFAPGAVPWAATAQERPIHSEMLLQTRNVIHSVIHEGHHLMAGARWMGPEECSAWSTRQRALREGLFAGTLDLVPLWGPFTRVECYDVRQDRSEQASTRVQDAAKVAALLALIEARGKRVAPQLADAFKCTQDTGSLTEEQRQQMETLGYISGGEASAPAREEIEEQVRGLGYL